MPIFWRSKTLLAKMETTYGTDPVPTGAANAILAQNVTLSPMEGEDVRRNLERPYFGANPSLPVGLRSVLTFDVEVVGSGTLGTAPGWGPLLRMCGVAEVITEDTSVEYNPITDDPESGCIYFQVGPTRHVLIGTRGNCALKLNAQGIPVFTFTLVGLFSVPTEAVMPTPNYSTFQAPQVATMANTPVFSIGGVDFNLREFSLDLGKQVEPRLLIGSEAILITGAEEAVTARVEAVPVSVFNPYELSQAATPQEVVLVHGTVGATRVRLVIPSAPLNRLSGLEENQGILEWPLSLTPQPIVGNDQWKITLS